MDFCSFGRFQLALQQNEILDVFYDDYYSLADDETTFGAKSDNYLKVLHSLKPNHFIIIPALLSLISWSFYLLILALISYLDLVFISLSLLSPLIFTSIHSFIPDSSSHLLSWFPFFTLYLFSSIICMAFTLHFAFCRNTSPLLICSTVKKKLSRIFSGILLWKVWL